MGKIFNVEDRQNTLDYLLSSADECSKIVSLVQVGSGAEGFHDEKSDLEGRIFCAQEEITFRNRITLS